MNCLNQLHLTCISHAYAQILYLQAWNIFWRAKKKEKEKQKLTFFLSLMEPLPRTIILQPVSASSCLAVSPRGPRILPTKLNCKGIPQKQNVAFY